MTNRPSAGYTLVELIVAVGLFAFVMMLVSSAYYITIGVNSNAQGIATGVNNLSFALETMSRTIRTGTAYACGAGGDCSGGTSFTFTNSAGTQEITYWRSTLASDCGAGASGCLMQTVHDLSGMNPDTSASLTDPVVNVTALKFFVLGTANTSPGADYEQPYVTLLIAGTITSGSGGKTQDFSLETSATMRGTDL